MKILDQNINLANKWFWLNGNTETLLSGCYCDPNLYKTVHKYKHTHNQVFNVSSFVKVFGYYQ